jgi:hypothetical protein
MDLLDNLAGSFISHILLPRIEDFSHPGFLHTKFIGAGRNVVFLEGFLSEIERRFYSNNQHDLYKIGKTAGYNYGKITQLDTVHTKGLRELSLYIRFLLLHIAGSYGAEVEYDLDIAAKSFQLSFSRYVVCEKNGIGLICLMGSAAGVMSWIFQDKGIESVQTECVGRGDARCNLIIGPSHKLAEKGVKHIDFTEVEDFDFDKDYYGLNKPQQPKYCKTSLQKLIDYQMVEIHKNIFTFQKDRLVILDIIYLYLLEKYLPAEVLYDVAKEAWRMKAQKLKDGVSNELLSAFGWGDINVIDNKIEIINYPYSPLYTTTTFPIIRGTLAGLHEGINKEKTDYLKFKPILSNNFTLIIK